MVTTIGRVETADELDPVRPPGWPRSRTTCAARRGSLRRFRAGRRPTPRRSRAP